MTKVKIEVECLKELVKRDSIVKVVNELPSKETADLNYIYIIPKEGEGKDKKAYVLRPDRTGYDVIDLTPQVVSVLGEGYITVEKETLNENGDVTFTVKTNETLTHALTEFENKDKEQDARLTDVTNRVIVLENRTDNDTLYDDSALKARVTALEERPQGSSYDDSALVSRINAIENKPEIEYELIKTTKAVTPSQGDNVINLAYDATDGQLKELVLNGNITANVKSPFAIEETTIMGGIGFNSGTTGDEFKGSHTTSISGEVYVEFFYTSTFMKVYLVYEPDDSSEVHKYRKEIDLSELQGKESAKITISKNSEENGYLEVTFADVSINVNSYKFQKKG